MNKRVCKDCKYFLQHYALAKEQLFPVYCGHCTHIRVKKRTPSTKACADFVPGAAKVYATREYLTRELLQYVLNKELLPEMEGFREVLEGELRDVQE